MRFCCKFGANRGVCLCRVSLASPECQARCDTQDDRQLKHFPHCSHLKGFSPVCFRWCVFRFDRFGKLLPQSAQTCGPPDGMAARRGKCLQQTDRRNKEKPPAQVSWCRLVPPHAPPCPEPSTSAPTLALLQPPWTLSSRQPFNFFFCFRRRSCSQSPPRLTGSLRSFAPILALSALRLFPLPLTSLDRT